MTAGRTPPPAAAPARPLATRAKNLLGQSIGARGAETRAKLLGAAEALLRTMPIRDVKPAEITRSAGTSGPTFYVYFKDVPELMLALASATSDAPVELPALFAEAWTAANGLSQAERFVNGYVAYWQAHSHIFRARDLAAEEGDLRFWEVRVAAASPLVQAIAVRVRERIAAGALPGELNPSAVAGAIVALVERVSAARILIGRDDAAARLRLVEAAVYIVAKLLSPSVELAAGASAPTTSSQVASAVEAEARRALTARRQEVRLNLDGQMVGERGERTRTQLINATMRLVRTTPMRELSSGDIARAARTSKATFYLYFQDVEDAVLAALERVSDMSSLRDALRRLIRRHGRTDVAARAFVRFYFDWWRERRALFRIRNVVGDGGDERFLRARADAAAPVIATIAELIAERQAAGALPEYVRPTSVSGAYLAMLERLAVVMLAPLGGTVSADDVIDVSAYILTMMIGGPAEA